MDDIRAKADTPTPLRKALREARIEAAERSAVIVDLRDAEAARLEMLNEAIEPVFAEIAPEHLELFDRGLTQGETPRLWVDNVAHVAMGRDKRTYRFLVDTLYGRRVLAESTEIVSVVTAVTRYVAGRIVAREQALAATAAPTPEARGRPAGRGPPRLRVGPALAAFVIGVLVGIVLLFAVALLFAPR
jgi:hypothetical protein